MFIATMVSPDSKDWRYVVVSTMGEAARLFPGYFCFSFLPRTV